MHTITQTIDPQRLNTFIKGPLSQSSFDVTLLTLLQF